MKKVIKYFFITLVSLGALAIVAIIVFVTLVSNAENEEIDKKDTFANSAMMQITSYYDKNGYYPKSLNELPIYNNKEFVVYVDNNTFRYSSFTGDKPKYVFYWRSGGMNWTGYRCTNDESIFFKSLLNDKQAGVIGTYKTSFGAVCTVTDLH